MKEAACSQVRHHRVGGVTKKGELPFGMTPGAEWTGFCQGRLHGRLGDIKQLSEPGIPVLEVGSQFISVGQLRSSLYLVGVGILI